MFKRDDGSIITPELRKKFDDIQKQHAKRKIDWRPDQDAIFNKFGPDTTSAGLIKMLILNERERFGKELKVKMLDVEEKVDRILNQ